MLIHLLPVYSSRFSVPKEINCPEYFEDAFAMAMAPEFDNDFFNVL